MYITNILSPSAPLYHLAANQPSEPTGSSEEEVTKPLVSTNEEDEDAKPIDWDDLPDGEDDQK
ncbi:MAG TPA: hypothetical protein DCR93_06330 [Cytophagales bacterium]|nr:hypothetical protein [Cytophagales bacterium]HAP59127.1 hypothetical protein [Cytophagales bacterium]